MNQRPWVKPTMGFLGLGKMGTPMAQSLLRSGTSLIVWNRSAPASRQLAEQGAQIAESVEELFDRCDLVFTMLADHQVLDQVLDRSGGGIERLLPGRLLVNTATVPPDYSRALNREVVAAGGLMVEAPVSGSRRPAEQAQLIGMLAGPPDAVAQVSAIMPAMCAQVVDCGAIPNALTMKLAVNTFLIATVTGLAETYHFAERAGLDLNALRGVLDASQMASPISREKVRKIAEADRSPQASISDVHMNTRLILDAAAHNHAAMPLLEACEDLYKYAIELGHESLDMIDVIRALASRGPDRLGT